MKKDAENCESWIGMEEVEALKSARSFIDRISALGDSSAETSTLTVPPDVTVGGSEPPPGLVDSLVRDALRRSGLIATAEIDTPDGRVIEFRRSEP